MKSTVTYRAAGALEAKLRGHTITLDTVPPLGKDRGPSPKELLLASIGGCALLDVAHWLRKHRLPFDSLDVNLDAVPRKEYPSVFPRVDLVFSVEGPASAELSMRMIEGVDQSMTKYCAVSAMVSKVSPLHYLVRVNGAEIHHGEAKFW